MLAIKYSYHNLYNTIHHDKKKFCSEQYTSAFCYVHTQFYLACTCVYLFLVSPVAIFRTGFCFVEYRSGSFRSFLQSDY